MKLLILIDLLSDFLYVKHRKSRKSWKISLIAHLEAVLTDTNKYMYVPKLSGIAYHPKGKQVQYLTTGNGVSEHVRRLTNIRGKYGEINRVL